MGAADPLGHEKLSSNYTQLSEVILTAWIGHTDQRGLRSPGGKEVLPLAKHVAHSSEGDQIQEVVALRP